MKATITNALATAGLLAAVGAVPLMAQGHPGHGHGDQAPRAGMMTHQMMEQCPMARGGMMGAQVLLEHADELELSAEQIARLEAVREHQMGRRAEMMEAMTTVHEILTPEQREALQERMRSGMGGMMHGMHRTEGTPRMMHGMMRGHEHGSGAGMMGLDAPVCPMMGDMTGGTDTEHPHPGHRDEG